MIINGRKFLIARIALIAAILAIPALAQDGGLPGGYLMTDRWRSAYSVYSGVTNPAFVNEENYMSARYLFAGMIESSYAQELGFTMPLGLYDAAGVSWIVNGITSFEAEDGQSVVDQEHFIAVTYARKVSAGLTVGGNVNIITRQIPDVSDEKFSGSAMKLGYGVDIGAVCEVLRHRLFGNHKLGLSTNNIVNAMRGTEEKYSAALRFSLLSDFWNRRILYGADLVLKDILAGADDYQTGFEPATPWEFNHKFGVNIRPFADNCPNIKLYALFGVNDNGVDHYGFALGAKIPGVSDVRGIEVMTQFVSIANPANGGNEANANCVTFFARMEFGKHREEAFAGK